MTHAYNYLTSLGKAVQLQTVTPQDDIPTLINNLKAQNPPVQSLYVCSDPYLTVHSNALNTAAHNTNQGSPYINTMFEIEDHMSQHGGNAWFGSDFDELFAKAADYASEIMAKTGVPAKLPIFISSLSGGGAAHTSRKKGSKKKSARKKK